MFSLHDCVRRHRLNAVINCKISLLWEQEVLQDNFEVIVTDYSREKNKRVAFFFCHDL